MKKLIGHDIGSYVFDASEKTITLSGLQTNLTLDQLLLITNTTDGIIIFNFANPSLGATISSNIITLVYDTVSMSDTDKLQIFIDIPDEFENLKNAPDYLQTFAYYDAGTLDERINTITHSSTLLGYSYIETFAYAGASPNYRISSITLSKV